jgi:hypothetical protein
VVEEEFSGVHQDLVLVVILDHKGTLAVQVHHCSSHQTPQEVVVAVELATVGLLEMVVVMVVMVVTKHLSGHLLTLAHLVLQEPTVTSLEVAVVETSEITLAELEALVDGAAAVKAVKQTAAQTLMEMHQFKDLVVVAEEIILALVVLAAFILDTQHLEVRYGLRY